jgi:aminoacrylate hydrolase
MPHAARSGAEIYYEVHGAGPPVLCPGGWSITTGTGHASLPAVLRERFTTIVLNHRGLGRSTDPGGPLTTADFADDAAAVVRAADLGPVHVYGHGGLGACLSQHLAARSPELVDKLVVMAGWAGPDPHKYAQAQVFVDLLRHVGFAAFQRYGATLIHTPEYFNAHADDILSARGAWGAFAQTPEALLRVIEATIGHDARDVLGDIAAETLVVQSELDVIDPPRLGRELAALIPRARLEILPSAPHAYRTSPDAVARLDTLLRTFLDAS